MFKERVVISILAGASLFACSASHTNDAAVAPVASSSAPVGALSEQPKPPPLPSPTLAVPEDTLLAFQYDAVGVQIYTCQATAAGYAWKFQAPEASLFDRDGHLVVKHYAGPTWESVTDHSKVVAKKLQEFSARADAIPELLLQATTHDGDGLMTDVSYVQRLATTGGLAPTDGCDSAHVAATARVDYKASYVFSRPKAPGK